MEDKPDDTSKKPLLLLVDDVAENLQLLAQHLADDYELAFATDGEQALELVREINPDLILLDVMMPGIDGYETCRRLKKNPSSKAIPVIFLTARTEIDDVLKGFEVDGLEARRHGDGKNTETPCLQPLGRVVHLASAAVSAMVRK